MNFDNCEIYKGRKRIGLLPCKLIKKTDLCDEHFSIANVYNIEAGYTLIINGNEKFHVTDVRLQHKSGATHIDVFFETIAQHKRKQILRIHDWVNTGIAIGSLIVAIISLLVSLMR